jgi:uncharacterized delta-60 repeat protein
MKFRKTRREFLHHTNHSSSSQSRRRRLAIEQLEGRRVFAAGALDSSFDSDGLVTVNLGDSRSVGRGVVVQPDGKSVIVGESHGGRSSDFAVARYNVDGSLDTSFGGTGKVLTDFGNTTDAAYAVALQADGKIVVSGISFGTNWDSAVARYNTDGSLDTTFGGGDGRVTVAVSPSSTDYALDVAIDSNQQIVLGGYADMGGTGFDFSAVRLNSDGTLDNSFGVGGKATLDVLTNRNDRMSALEVLPDNRIVLVGSSFNGADDDFSVVRLTAAGTPDSSFSGDGKLTQSFTVNYDTATAVAIGASGSVFVAGYIGNGTTTDVIVVKYTAAGVPDSSFGTSGVVTTDIDSSGNVAASIGAGAHNVVNSVAYDSASGKVTVGGSIIAGGATDFLFARYNTNGSLDSGFSGNGILTAPVGTGNDTINAIALSPSGGSLVAAGMSAAANGNESFAAARISSTGVLDTTFDGDGKTATVMGNSDDFTRSVVVQPDGKTLVAGYSYVNTVAQFAISRFNVDGSLDATFGVGGKAIFPLRGIDDVGLGMTLQSDGKIVVVGYSNGSTTAADFGVMRLTSSGARDATFGITGTGYTATDLLGQSRSDTARSVVVQPDGRIVVVGYSHNGSNFDFAVARYLSTGALDTSFGTNGQRVIPIGSLGDYATSVALQSDGKIVIAGYSEVSGGTDVAVVRLNGTNGSDDTSFGVLGKKTLTVGTVDTANDVLIQSDGKIVLGGQTRLTGSDNDFLAMRLLSNGTLDSGFNGTGSVAVDLGTTGDIVYGVELQSDGKVLLGGVAYGVAANIPATSFAAVRLTTAGSLDTSFDGDGKLQTAFGSTTNPDASLAMHADGRFVIASNRINGVSSDIVVAKYVADPVTRTWDGGGTDDNWSTAANWVGDVAPISGDSLVFDTNVAGVARFTATNDLANLLTTTISVIDDSATNSFTLNGSSIVIGAGISGTGSQNSTTISFSNLRLASSQTFSLGAGAMTIQSPLDTNGAAFTFDVGGAAVATLAAVVSGSGSVTKSGSGRLELNAANTYQGATIVNEGVFDAGNIAALGTTTTNTTIANGATLRLLAGGTTAEPFTVNQGGDLWLYFGSMTLTGAMNLGGRVVSNNQSQTMAGDITLTSNTASISSSVGPSVLTVSGRITDGGANRGVNLHSHFATSTLQLDNSTNSYTGPTSITGSGQLRLGAAGVIPNLSAVTVDASSTLELNNFNETIGSLAGAGSIALGSGSLTTGGDNSSTSFSGVLSGAGGVTKEGTGVFTVTGSGTNSFSGDTTISAGTLAVNASHPNSPIYIHPNGTLAGTGTVFQVTALGGQVAPGQSPGVLDVGGITFSSPGSSLAIEINGLAAGTEYDQLEVNGPGAIVLSNGALNVALNFIPNPGDRFMIVKNNTTDPLGLGSNKFLNLPEGAQIIANGTPLEITYVGGDGNDVELVVPNLFPVSGTNWNDANGNGVHEASEAGLSGWTVFADVNNNGVFDANEPQAITRTDDGGTSEDEAGQYSLSLPAGDFTIRRVGASGFGPSFPTLLPGILPGSFAESARAVTVANQPIQNIDFGNFSNRLVSFTASSQSVGENAGILEILGTLDTPLGFDLMVPVSVNSGGTATQDVDYQLLGNSILFVAGSTTGKLLLDIVDDVRYESSESLTLSLQPTLGVSLGSIAQHTVTITNNDAMPTVAFLSTSQTGSEGSTVEVGVKLSGETDLDVTVPLLFAGSTATGPGAGNDFTIVGGSSTITIPAGSRTASKSLTITDDTIGEKAESIQVRLGTLVNAIKSQAKGDPQTHAIAIPLNDQPSVAFNQTQLTRNENAGSVDVVVQLSNASASTVTVPFSIGGTAGSTDRTFTIVALPGHNDPPIAASATSGTITFNPGTTSRTLRIQITSDSLNEIAETVLLTMGDVQNATAGTSKTFMLKINDDDIPEIQFKNTNPSTAWEDAGSVTFTVTTTLASVQDLSIPLVLSKSNSNGSSGYAQIGSTKDFTVSLDPLVIPAGQFEVSRTISLRDDSSNESKEQISLQINNPNIGRLGKRTSQSITILDDDPGVNIRRGQADVTEDNTSINYTVSLDDATNQDVAVRFIPSGSASSSSDYTINTSTAGISTQGGKYYVTIPAGSTSRTITVNIKEDSKDEPSEYVTLELSSPTGGASIVYPSSDTTTIADDDSPPTVSFTTSDFPINENNTSKQAISVKLSTASAYDVYVRPGFVLDGVAAYLNTDFKVKGLDSSGYLKIPAGSTSGTFYVQIVDRSGYQGDRSFRIVLNNATSATADKSSVYIYIVDNESRPQKYVVGAGQVGLDTTSYVYDVGASNPGSGTVAVSGGGKTYGPGQVAIATGSAGFLDGTIAFFDANFNGVLDFLDLNHDGIQDEGEPDEPSTETQPDGAFSLIVPREFDLDQSNVFESSEGRWVLVGGVDTSTGLTWTSRMYASIGDFVVNPLSSLVEHLVRGHSYSLEDAETRMMSAFELPTVDFGTFNALSGLEQGDETAGRYWVMNIELYATVVQIAKLFSGKSGTLPVDYFADLVYADIAAKIADPETSFDVVSPEIVADIINGVSFVTGLEFTDEIIAGAATIIATGNQTLAALPASSKTDATEIVKVKKVFQGDAAATLQTVGAGPTLIADAVAQFTGTNLATRIATTTVGNIFPSSVVITDAVVHEGDAGTNLLEFTVQVLSDHTDTVTVDFATNDALAVAGDDYVATTGTLTWLPGDNSPRTIQVTVNSDLQFEQDEMLRVVLSNGHNAVLRRQAGFGFIVNDDAGAFSTSVAPESGENEVVLRLTDLRASLEENGSAISDGAYSEPVHVSINGQSDIDDTFVLDFTAGTYRADVINYVGGSGTGIDSAVILGGAFDTITQRFTTSTDGQLILDPSSSDANIEFNWFGLEPFEITGNSDHLIFELPAGATNVILEDADPTDTNPALVGMMRLRSPVGDFETTTFLNPTTSLVIRGGNGADSITLASVDPAFIGNLVIDGNALGTGGVSVTATNLTLPGGLTVEDATFTVNGIVFADGPIAFNAGTTLKLDLLGGTSGTGHDQLQGNGVELGGATLDLTLAPGFTPKSTLLELVRNTSESPTSGTFDSLSEGQWILLDNRTIFQISYGGVSNNDVALIVLDNVPVADSQSTTTNEDTAVSVILTGSDADGDLLTYSIVSAPTHGTLSGSGVNRTYTPTANFHGGDSFTFRVNDGLVDSPLATVSLTVNSVNDVPVANSQAVTTDEDTAVAITLSGNDVDGDVLTYSIVNGPTNGTLTGSGVNRTYTPAPDFFGADSFTFRVNDGVIDSPLATITITVNSIIDAPPGSVQLTGGPGNDRFTVVYSSTEITVDWSADGGPVTHFGPYGLNTALLLDGLGGADSLTLALTPQQIAGLTTADIGTLKAYLAGPTGKSVALNVPSSSLFTATGFESADLAANDDSVVASIAACFANITNESQIQAGTGGPDTLTGTSAADLIFGGDGDDLISGLDGADCLLGGAGNDSLLGGSGDDRLEGGSGNDSLVGDLGFDWLRGGLGNDTLDGGLHDDQLDGGPDVDTILGGPGYDIVRVRLDEAAYDSVNGGDNTDSFLSDTAAPVVLAGFNAAIGGMEGWIGNGQPIFGTESNDNFTFLITASYSLSMSGVPYIDGRGGDDILYGTNGVDVLRGGEGNDTLLGLGGVDTLFGDAGNDSLNGGDGVDHLYGGDGVDTITTGAGRDIVYFVGDLASLDTLTDFALYSDSINLQAYAMSYSQVTFTIVAPNTTINLANGKKIRLNNWNRAVGSSQFKF